ncbi:MAG TPA: NAD-dependent epimerase/dehydratase family protein [Pyrinomonadaceae bacterium]|nr:NAD-dependent epimerase/dehydratase family protein [Pyrinomonadaceae bacterium]
MPINNLLAEDLDFILDATAPLWEEMRGANLFITGGTGFFGCWILESFLRANERLDLCAAATVLTRNPAAFEKKAAHLALNPATNFISSDVGSFEFPEKRFDFIIHAATDVYNQVAPLETVDTIVEGTRRVLEFAKHCDAKKVLLTSSGAVYGRQPPELRHTSEDYAGAPNPVDLKSVYGEGKRMAELLGAIYAAENGYEVKIARCFAFVGAYLPLDGHLAVGNFIRDALRGDAIHISGDGSPVRSYMYAADLAVWLWTILFRGASARPYNVGSETDISLADLARMISVLPEKRVEVKIARKKSISALPERYVPQTRRAFEDLGLQATVDLESAIRKTMRFYKGSNHD